MNITRDKREISNIENMIIRLAAKWHDLSDADQERSVKIIHEYVDNRIKLSIKIKELSDLCV